MTNYPILPVSSVRPCPPHSHTSLHCASFGARAEACVSSSRCLTLRSCLSRAAKSRTPLRCPTPRSRTCVFPDAVHLTLVHRACSALGVLPFLDVCLVRRLMVPPRQAAARGALGAHDLTVLFERFCAARWARDREPPRSASCQSGRVWTCCLLRRRCKLPHKSATCQKDLTP
jgi:hypothetical protein